MKKLLQEKKALSPVVAAIIMIAVTVAVSIAVAAWMGALTFTFMKTEELRITSVSFSGYDEVAGTYPTAIISFRNTGASSLTIVSVTVDDLDTDSNPDLLEGGLELAKGAEDIITLNDEQFSYEPGYKYTFALLTSNGNKFTYTTTATS